MGQTNLSTRELYDLLKKSQEEQTEKLTREITKNREEFNRKTRSTQKSIKSLNNRYLTVERKQRKNNIIVFGLEVRPDKVLEDTLSVLNQKLSLKLEKGDINNIYLIGKEENKRGVLIEFISYLNKQDIFKNVSKLKGSKISITNDLCPTDRETQKILVKHLSQAKSENKQAKIKGFHIEIEGQTFSAGDLEKEESESELYSDTDDITEDEADVEKKNKKHDILKSEKKDIIKRKRGKSTTQKNSPIKTRGTISTNCK